MAEERIRVVIYDDELTALMERLNTVRSAEPKVKKTKESVDAIDKWMKSKDAKEFLKNIPRISRAERLAMTQIPGARMALQQTYRAKMLAGVSPYLVVAVLAIYVTKQIMEMWREIQRQRGEYEDLLRRGLDISHREYQALAAEQRGYATWLDQFQARVESQGFVDAIAEAVWMRLVELLPVTPPIEEQVLGWGFALKDGWVYNYVNP